MHGVPAGILTERDGGRSYAFTYLDQYAGPPISLTMPVRREEYVFPAFPPFFEGLLPEGALLEGLVVHRKLESVDFFSQLVAVGCDLVGAITVKELA